MDDATVQAALRWFPLTGHARPACPPLPERVREITQLADAARRPGANVLSEAPHALNKAALLASDCGLPDLASDLCSQHINVYLSTGRPLMATEARGILGPALNLARLSLRVNDPAAALRRLDSIYQGLMKGTNVTLDDMIMPLAGLTGTQAEIRQLRQDVWLQYLSVSIHACSQLGQWDLAAKHAEAHRGIGTHLMDGRQAAIIALIVGGDHEEARHLLAETTATQPWEQHVASCLSAMCSTDTDTAARTMTSLFLETSPDPGYIVFRARLALTIAAIAAETHPGMTKQVLAKAVGEVIESGDGYAARDLLAMVQNEDLATLVDRAGLDAGSIPEPFPGNVLAAASCSASLLKNNLSKV